MVKGEIEIVCVEKEREEEERESIDRFAPVQNRVWGDLSVFAVIHSTEFV